MAARREPEAGGKGGVQSVVNRESEVSHRVEVTVPVGRVRQAFDRAYLLLVSPTGTGWVDQTMIESAELLTRGDIATACIQYVWHNCMITP